MVYSNKNKHKRKIVSGKQALIFLLLALIITACGGDDKEEPAPVADAPQPTTAAPAADPTAVPEPTAEPAMFVQSLDGVKDAIIRIEAVGTFIDPQVGTIPNALGGGSGFIINEEGLAVTNNHVVTGAGFLKVYVGGEDDPRNAKVLGVSECSDLAVIDLEGDGYTYMKWDEGEASVGKDVYAAGFPLGDPEFTLTRGIISKANAGGETNWSSVDNVLEHDATINPGNSGGPLVTADGAIVGVNYAGNSNTNQYFAIKQAEALKVIDILSGGENVTSIGVNGTAINDGEGLSGIWVSSVESGSPADNAGILPGDIIMSIENIFMAVDGTMSDYCDILRSHDADDTLNVEVLRFDTGEFLEGQLNGEVLAVSQSFANDLGDEVAQTGGGGGAYSSYVEIVDESELLRVEVPAEWTDINGADWVRDENSIGVALRSSGNLDDWYANWHTPGMFFGASSNETMLTDPITMLDQNTFNNDCDYVERVDYEDSLYKGAYDVWENCGGEDMLFVNLSAWPEEHDFIILVQITVITQADLDALDQILDSFIVDVD